MLPPPVHRARVGAGLLLLLTALLSASCGGEEPPAPAAPLESLHWPAMEGAEHYTVRLWSGYRLLMEETTRDTVLVFDENLRRTAAAFDSLSLEVVGYSGSEESARKLGRSRSRIRP